MIKLSYSKRHFIILYSILTVLVLGAAFLIFKKSEAENSPENAIKYIQSHIDYIDNESKVILEKLQNHTIDTYLNDSVGYIILKSGSPVFWNHETKIYPDSFIIESAFKYKKGLYEFLDTFIYTHRSGHDEYEVIVSQKIFNNTGQVFSSGPSGIEILKTFPFRIEMASSASGYQLTNSIGQDIYLTISNYQYKPNEFLAFLLHFIFISLIILISKVYKKVYSYFNRFAMWISYFFIQSIFIYIIFFSGINIFGMNNTAFFQTIVYTYKDSPLSIGQIFYISILSLALVLSYYNNVYTYNPRKLKNHLLKNICKTLLLVLYFIIVLPIVLYSIKENQILYSYYDFSRVNYISILALITVIVNVLSIIIISYSIVPVIKPRFNALEKALIVFLYILGLSYFVIRFESIQTTFYEYAFICLIFFILLAFTLPSIIKSNVNNRINYFHLLSYKGFILCLLICIWITNMLFISNYQRERLLRREIANSLYITNDYIAEFKLQKTIDEWLAADSSLFINDKKEFATQQLDIYTCNIFKNFSIENIRLYNRTTLPLNYINIIDEDIQSPSGSNLYSKINIDQNEYLLLYENKTRGRELYIAFELSIPEYYIKNELALFNEKSNYSTYYSVAIFYKNYLRSISGIDENVQEFEQHIHNSGFKDNLSSSYFTQKNPDNQIIVIKYNRFILLQYLTSLSYCIIIVYGVCFTLVYTNNKKIFSLKLEYKDKINLGIISIVSISFILLSLISITYLKSEFEKEKIRRIKNLKDNYQTYVNNLLFMVNDHKPWELKPYNVQAIIDKMPYNNIYAEKSRVDFFNISGIQEDNGVFLLLDYKIRKAMNNFSLTLSPRNETVSKNLFTQFYENDHYIYHLLNINSEKKGILQFVIPQTEDDNQSSINNIITILINTYVLLFLLSILVTIFIVNSLTKGIQKLTNQIKKLSLTKNTPIQYDNNDEIAVLVKEYNAMLKNLEIMAANLANSERESAWREAAKQVAHEINNPITPIKLNIQYLIKEAESEKDISKLFLKVSKSIIIEIDKLSQIAESFSNYGRMTEPIFEKIDIIHHIRSVITILYVDTRIKLSISDSEEPVYVYADEKFLNIAFMNIIKNAFQALENRENPALNINIHTEFRNIYIAVQDNGIGMTEEVRHKIFVPNFTTKTSGKGIGLSTTKSMILSMNGNIYVTSEHGIGTTFTVSFPVID